jgi:NTE family protein
LARKRGLTAFVLSGGGIFGALQVGMLKALYEREIMPDLVVGCSVGALNGAVICQWPGSQGIDRLIRTWEGASDTEIFPGNRYLRLLMGVRQDHLYPRDGLERLIDENIAFERIEELPIQLRIVACDLDSGEEVVFSRGPLRPALLASTALPGAFPPVHHEGRRLIDGGVVNNVPISVADQRDVRKIFVLNVASDIDTGRIRTAWDVIYQAFSIAKSQRWLSELAKYSEDPRVLVLPRPEPVGVAFDEFSRSEELMEEAYQMSKAYLRQAAA